jgi:hypothetical protein
MNRRVAGDLEKDHTTVPCFITAGPNKEFTQLLIQRVPGFFPLQ